MKLNKLTASLATVAALTFGSSAYADPINVGGVVWDPDSFFDFTATTNLYETIGTSVGETFSGYGMVTQLNGTLPATFCPGCELTYSFDGYVITSFTVGGQFTATGGVLSVFVDHAPDFNPLIKSTALDGALWLSLAGDSTFFDSVGTFPPGTTLVGSTTIPNNFGISGVGQGYFDVVGGLAAANLDTNTQPGGADLTYTSSFQPLPGPIVNDGVVVATHFGTNEVLGQSIPIPEPATLALLGLGLVGLALSRRTKKA